jgi:hypothetical protein
VPLIVRRGAVVRVEKSGVGLFSALLNINQNKASPRLSIHNFLTGGATNAMANYYRAGPQPSLDMQQYYDDGANTVRFCRGVCRGVHGRWPFGAVAI